MARQGSLLGSGPEIEGFLYRVDFVTGRRNWTSWSAFGPWTFTR